MVKRCERRAPAAGRDFQVASADGLMRRWDFSTRADLRELKRRQRRAPTLRKASWNAPALWRFGRSAGKPGDGGKG